LLTLQEKIVEALLILAIVAVYVFELSIFARLAVYRILKKEKPHRVLVTKPAIVSHALALGCILCLLWSYFVEPYRLEVTRHEIRTGLLAGTSFRIVLLSDTHCDAKMRCEEKLVEKINALGPDIIVFTGDGINDLNALPLFKKTMKALSARLGKFAVNGNHETWYWWDRDVFGGTGFRLLKTEPIIIEKDNERITVFGMDYADYELGILPIPLPADTYNIFLFHYPDLIEYVSGASGETEEDVNVNLYLCGHTHGGQVRLPFYGGLEVYSKFGKKYEMGMYRVKDTTLYVNRGIGMEGGFTPRIRFLCRPEITVFDLKPEKGK